MSLMTVDGFEYSTRHRWQPQHQVDRAIAFGLLIGQCQVKAGNKPSIRHPSVASMRPPRGAPGILRNTTTTRRIEILGSYHGWPSGRVLRITKDLTSAIGFPAGLVPYPRQPTSNPSGECTYRTLSWVLIAALAKLGNPGVENAITGKQ